MSESTEFGNTSIIFTNVRNRIMSDHISKARIHVTSTTRELILQNVIREYSRLIEDVNDSEVLLLPVPKRSTRKKFVDVPTASNNNRSTAVVDKKISSKDGASKDGALTDDIPMVGAPTDETPMGGTPPRGISMHRISTCGTPTRGTHARPSHRRCSHRWCSLKRWQILVLMANFESSKKPFLSGSEKS